MTTILSCQEDLSGLINSIREKTFTPIQLKEMREYAAKQIELDDKFIEFIQRKKDTQADLIKAIDNNDFPAVEKLFEEILVLRGLLKQNPRMSGGKFKL